MDKAFVQIIEKVRKFLVQEGMGDISLDKLESVGISKEDILQYVDSKEELVEKVLEFERSSFVKYFLNTILKDKMQLTFFLLLVRRLMIDLKMCRHL